MPELVDRVWRGDADEILFGMINPEVFPESFEPFGGAGGGGDTFAEVVGFAVQKVPVEDVSGLVVEGECAALGGKQVVVLFVNFFAEFVLCAGPTIFYPTAVGSMGGD